MVDRQKEEVVSYEVSGVLETLLLTGRPYRILADPENGEPLGSLEEILPPSETLAALIASENGQIARSQLRTLRDIIATGRRRAELHFENLKPGLRAALTDIFPGETPWKQLTGQSVWTTHIRDAIEVMEIGRLGKS